MEVICLEDDAFYALVNEVVSRINAMQGEKEEKRSSFICNTK